MERGDVGVIQLGEKLRFALESGQTVLVSRELVGKHFDGDVAIEPRVPSAVDLVHAPGTDRLNHFVLRQSIAGIEGHVSCKGNAMQQRFQSRRELLVEAEAEADERARFSC